MARERTQLINRAPPFESLEPMLFGKRFAPFDDDAYTHELKFDGYRLLAEADRGRVALKTRNGADATHWFPEITASLGTLGGGRHVLDGEVCVLDEFGRADFDRLHVRAKARGQTPGADPVVYCVFDLLVYAGEDVRDMPLARRKIALRRLLRRKRPSVLLVESFNGGGTWLYRQAVALRIEGIVSKRLDSPYESGIRSSAWVKVKRPGAVPPQRFKRVKRLGNPQRDGARASGS